MSLHYTSIPAALLGLGLVVIAAYAARGEVARAKKAAKTLAMFSILAWLIYTIPFITLDYRLKPVYESTSPGLPVWLRPATAWSSGGGSLYLFTVIAVIALWLISRPLKGHEARTFLSLAPALPLVSLAAAFMFGAFDLNPVEATTGMGLNPLLKSIWLYPHPLTTFGGYALLAMSCLAFAMGFRPRIAWIIYEVGWAFLTTAIMLGGLWSYETFGWGGYWAWDPVETSELMVWLAATTLPHLAVTLRSLFEPMASLTLSTVFLAMFVTRTGLSPLHSFAAPGLAAMLLLLSSVAALLYTIWRLLQATGIYTEFSKSISKPETLGLLVASITLGIAAVFVTFSLLAPAVVNALGGRASAPTMESGIRFYHPVLYPLAIAMLAFVPASFIGERLGWRGFAAYIAAVSVAAGLAGYSAYIGALNLAPLSPLTTNIEMAVGIVYSVAAIAALVVAVTLRLWRCLKRRIADRLVPIAFIHIGFALVLLGVFMGGTYSFNQSYFKTYTLKPGESVVLPGGVTLTLESYEYSIANTTVDIFTPYVGKWLYQAAQNAIITLRFDIANIVSRYARGVKGLNQSIYAIVKHLMENPVKATSMVSTVSPRVNVTLQNLRLNETLAIQIRDARIELRNVTVRPALIVIGEGHGTRRLALCLELNAANVTLYTPDARLVTPSPHIIYEFRLSKPWVIEGNGVKIIVKRVAFMMNVTSYRIHHVETMVKSSAVILGPLFGQILEGSFTYNGVNVTLGPLTNQDVAYALSVEANPVLKKLVSEILSSSLAQLLENPSRLRNVIYDPRCPGEALAIPGHPATIIPGCVSAPEAVPETAFLTLTFRIEGPGGVKHVKATLRFEVNGEIQGIHGLVAKVIHATMGLSDVYIAVHPPTVESIVSVPMPGGHEFRPEFHDLALYYLHEVFKRLPPEKRLALASLLATGLYSDVLREQGLTREEAGLLLEAATIALYLTAEKYNTSKPPVATQGVVIQVKLVPGTPFVWGGSVLMTLSALAAAAIRATQARTRS